MAQRFISGVATTGITRNGGLRRRINRYSALP